MDVFIQHFEEIRFFSSIPTTSENTGKITSTSDVKTILKQF